MQKQMSDSLIVAIILTFIGGFLEIYSFLLKGNVFATAITGNIVMFFYHTSHLNFHIVLKYLLPILSFSLGIILSEKIREYFNKTKFHWREYVLIFEMLIVITLAFLENYELLSIILISMMSGIQIQTFKRIDKTVYMSTMCTGNTRRFIESMLHKQYNVAKSLFIIITSFASGTIIGAFLIKFFEYYSILVLIFPLILAYFLVHKNK